MNEQMYVKSTILYLSAFALVLFYLLYAPWTALSAYASGMGGEVWIYYLALLLGLFFPLFYATGHKNKAWIVLGLSIALNSLVWISVELTAAAEAFLTLIIGLLIFIGPVLEPRVSNWNLVKNLLHILKGLFIILADGFYADWILDDFIQPISIGHIMPPFLYMGGGLLVVFGIVLLAYGTFALVKIEAANPIGKSFGDLTKIFHVLMVIISLLGITYNVTIYVFLNAWGAVSFPSLIYLFADMSHLGSSSLGSILLIVLYIYGMLRIAEELGPSSIIGHGD